MWPRLIGSGLLLLCGGLWTRGKTAAARAELARVAALCELFAYIGTQVEAYCLPLDEIVAGAAPDLRRACGLEEAPLLPTLTALGDTLRDTEAAETLSRAAARLGRGDPEDQVRLCRGVAQTLEKCRDRLSAAAARDGRARGTLCLTACLFVIILLW